MRSQENFIYADSNIKGLAEATLKRDKEIGIDSKSMGLSQETLPSLQHNSRDLEEVDYDELILRDYKIVEKLAMGIKYAQDNGLDISHMNDDVIAEIMEYAKIHFDGFTEIPSIEDRIPSDEPRKTVSSPDIHSGDLAEMDYDELILREYNIIKKVAMGIKYAQDNGLDISHMNDEVMSDIMEYAKTCYSGFPKINPLENPKASHRLFVDMDGTLAEFKSVNTLETLYEKGYFLNLKPTQNVVEAVKTIITSNPEVEVYSLSSVLPDSKYALNEKNAWLDKYLPEIDNSHRLFPPCGSNKMAYVSETLGAVSEKDFLLDDYTPNLTDWEPPGKGIKVLNGINHTRGSWQSSKLSNVRQPGSLADAICKCMSGEEISDLKAVAPIKPPMPQIEI